MATQSGGSGGSTGMADYAQVAAMMIGAVGAYFNAISQREALRTQAISLQLRGDLAGINARQAEYDAAAFIEASHREQGRVSQAYAQLEGQQVTQQAAANLDLGIGSAAEVRASAELARQQDIYNMRIAAVRQENQLRGQAVGFRIDQAVARTSANALNRSASRLNPWLSAGSSLLTSAASSGYGGR